MDPMNNQASQLTLTQVDPQPLCQSQPIPIPKKNRKNLTSYWGISLDHNIHQIFEHPQIKSQLSSQPQLINLEHIHSTLLYVGKKEDNPHEQTYLPIEGKECQLVITTFGCSGDAAALLINEMTYINDQNETVTVPTHAFRQHVTLSLKKGIKAVDSIKCFDNGLIQLSEPMIITGKIKRYLF